MSKSPPITIASAELRARVEGHLGARIPGSLWEQAEALARRKIDLNRQRRPDVTHYDNEYLVLLAGDTVRETVFSHLLAARAT